LPNKDMIIGEQQPQLRPSEVKNAPLWSGTNSGYTCFFPVL